MLVEMEMEMDMEIEIEMEMEAKVSFAWFSLGRWGHVALWHSDGMQEIARLFLFTLFSSIRPQPPWTETPQLPPSWFNRLKRIALSEFNWEWKGDIHLISHRYILRKIPGERRKDGNPGDWDGHQDRIRIRLRLRFRIRSRIKSRIRFRIKSMGYHRPSDSNHQIGSMKANPVGLVPSTCQWFVRKHPWRKRKRKVEILTVQRGNQPLQLPEPRVLAWRFGTSCHFMSLHVTFGHFPSLLVAFGRFWYVWCGLKE